jgi:transcriptional regulator with XRE-family HTH domain
MGYLYNICIQYKCQAIGVFVREKPVPSRLPERLRQIRKQQNLSQHELSRLCGYGVNQINRIEQGTREPVVSGLIKIATVLGVSIDYLVGLTDEPQATAASTDLTAHERELLETFRAEGWSGILHMGVERLAK